MMLKLLVPQTGRVAQAQSAGLIKCMGLAHRCDPACYPGPTHWIWPRKNPTRVNQPADCLTGPKCCDWKVVAVLIAAALEAVAFNAATVPPPSNFGTCGELHRPDNIALWAEG